ncbi:DUF3224 domain-containing protein, partial [Streptomyces sp. NPDC001193]
MSARTTTGRFTFADWQEQPIGPAGSTPRLARSTVVNAFAGGIEAGATHAAYTIAYTVEGTGSYTGLELLSGAVDGRKGAFVLRRAPRRGAGWPAGSSGADAP